MASTCPATLLVSGDTYRLAEWLTFQDYSHKYHVPLSTISVRLLRGNIGPADVLEVPR